MSLQARKLINDVRHSSDLMISDTATNDVFDALTDVLSDKSFDGDSKVVDARTSLDKVIHFCSKVFSAEALICKLWFDNDKINPVPKNVDKM